MMIGNQMRRAFVKLLANIAHTVANDAIVYMRRTLCRPDFIGWVILCLNIDCVLKSARFQAIHEVWVIFPGRKCTEISHKRLAFRMTFIQIQNPAVTTSKFTKSLPTSMETYGYATTESVPTIWDRSVNISSLHSDLSLTSNTVDHRKTLLIIIFGSIFILPRSRHFVSRPIRI